MDYLPDHCRRCGLLVGTAAFHHLRWAERCPDRQFHSSFCLARLDLDRNLSWLSLFREMARALAAHSGAVCAVLACHVDFRWSRLRLAWALQLIDRRGWDRLARQCDLLDESETAMAVSLEVEKD
jgi:hypothetical protein